MRRVGIVPGDVAGLPSSPEPSARSASAGEAAAAAVFEATMSREQAERLVELMREGLPSRPEGVVSAALLADGERVSLIAFWRDRATLEAYLASVPVPRGTELMRGVGVEPRVRFVDVLELG